MKSAHSLAAASVVFAGFAVAGEADILDVSATLAADGTWRFDVTVRHDDEGWDHYADAWQVLAPDGSILAVRTLFHPHDREQPFTRSLGGIKIPADVQEVEVRAHDSVHGFGASVTVDVSEETASQ